ncbi:flagellar hook-length control protein FliK [Aeromonas bivalvium]|uniref:flagellar hook-length control protein FliK n=1 Tax=Aeromonas bivalvium TaxID=440079 RepID=UPI0005A87818|nr:flagellar hook-length control protein FliK [Aeromonas bivalvium]
MGVIRNLDPAALAAVAEQGAIHRRQPADAGQGYQPLEQPLDPADLAALAQPLPGQEEASEQEGMTDEEALAAAMAAFLARDGARGGSDPVATGFSRRAAAPSMSPPLTLETLQARFKLGQPVAAPVAADGGQISVQTPGASRAGDSGSPRPALTLPPALLAALGAEPARGEGAEVKGTQTPTLVTGTPARQPDYQWAPARLADNPAQWGQQLVEVLRDKVEMQVNHQIKQAHIRLDPPELGRLELTVRMEGDKLSVQLNAASPAVRDALIQSMERLRMSLAPHHAGGVEVNVGQGGEQERRQAWQQDEILAGRREWTEEDPQDDTRGRDWLNTLV